MRHENVKKKILGLVEARPQVVTNYNDLILAYWVAYDGVNKLRDVLKATPAETIRREFQKLSEAGMIKPPRRNKPEKVRAYQHDLSVLT